jgi:beta-N-acetylglucosaminidase
MDTDNWSEFPEVVPTDHPLDQFLSGKLAGQGSAFESAGAQYGVDPTLLASIATFESGHGQSHAINAFNNVSGTMNPQNSSQFLLYDSVPDSINATARNLSQNYLAQGLTTIPQIGAKYSPVNAPNDPGRTNSQWPSSVSQLYSQFGGTKTNFAPTPVQGVGDAVNIMGNYNSWDQFPAAQQASN